MTKAREVTGSDDFSSFFESLSDENQFKLEIRNAIKILLEDCTKGEKIQHNRWSDHYIKKYKINNLWRYELLKGKRLIYTILGSSRGFTVAILEAFENHTKYDNRFGY